MDSAWSRLTDILAQVDRKNLAGLLRLFGLVSLVALFVLIGAILIGFGAFTIGNPTLSLAAGQVAPEDIRAPFGITYDSVVLTEQARQSAMERVPGIYDPPDPNIARQQVELARQILDFVADVRSDEYASADERWTDIQAISALSLNYDMIFALLNTPADRWEQISQQIIVVTERAMRDEIRDDNLHSIRQNIPNLVSVSFRVDEVALITAIVEDLVRTNTFFNEELTQQARDAAGQSVEPSKVEIRQGQLIVRGGEIVTDADMEALTKLGLLQPEDSRLQELLSAFLIMLLVTSVLALYLNRYHEVLAHDLPFMVLLGVIFLVTLAGIRVTGPQRVVQPYIFPTAALGILVTTLAGPQIAILGTAVLAALFGIMTGGALSLATMALLGGFAGILSLRRSERINSYFVAGTIIGLTNVGVVLVFYLIGYPTDPLGALTLIGAGLLNGILAAATALIGLYIISSLFNLPTSLKLIELMQPSQPLLQRLLREAPGTYQHSLQVANLAELAAERIGVNATLTRVGALYHDVGKMAAPHFFVENQADGVNPHDALNDPFKSARIIMDHVIEGEKLARKYRLPTRMRDFILEHHGTTRPMYFYRKALEQAGSDENAVDIEQFTYPGPRPRSPETAILMLADSCESTVRARRPQNKQEIADVVKYVFDTRMDEGQLNQSGLRLNDLSVIQRVFVETLQGVFHPRIAYTSAQTPSSPAASSPQEQPPVPAAPSSGDGTVHRSVPATSLVARNGEVPPAPVSPVESAVPQSPESNPKETS